MTAIGKEERKFTGRNGQSIALSQLERSRLVLGYMRLRSNPRENREFINAATIIGQEQKKRDDEKAAAAQERRASA